MHPDSMTKRKLVSFQAYYINKQPTKYCQQVITVLREREMILSSAPKPFDAGKVSLSLGGRVTNQRTKKAKGLLAFSDSHHISMPKNGKNS